MDARRTGMGWKKASHTDRTVGMEGSDTQSHGPGTEMTTGMGGRFNKVTDPRTTGMGGTTQGETDMVGGTGAMHEKMRTARPKLKFSSTVGGVIEKPPRTGQGQFEHEYLPSAIHGTLGADGSTETGKDPLTGGGWSHGMKSQAAMWEDI